MWMRAYLFSAKLFCNDSFSKNIYRLIIISNYYYYYYLKDMRGVKIYQEFYGHWVDNILAETEKKK